MCYMTNDIRHFTFRPYVNSEIQESAPLGAGFLGDS